MGVQIVPGKILQRKFQQKYPGTSKKGTGKMDHQKILISVIIPVYNVKKYLESSIRSIKDQTYKNLEIILVDDGSTDGSGQICDMAAEKDARIRVIHKENSGVSDARNMGLDQVHGQYVSFLDSDDVYAPYAMDCLLNAILSCDAEIATGEYRKFEEEITFEPSVGNKPCIISGREAVSRMIGKEHIRYAVVHNKLFKTELLRDFQFLSGKIHEDEEFMYRILYSARKIATIAQVIYGYRTRPDSIMSSKYNRNRLNILEIAKERANFFRQQGDRELCENFSWVYAMLLLQHYPKVRKDLKDPDLARKLRKEYQQTVPELLHAPSLSGKRKLMTAVFYAFPGQYAPLMEMREKSIKNVRNRAN